MFKDGASKIYNSTEDSCDCTFHKENRAPCHHILWIRKDDYNVEMFDLNMFDLRYHRAKADEVVLTTNEDTGVCDENQNTLRNLDRDESQTPAISLTDREKYRCIMPLLTTIGNLVCCYSTDQFFRYLNELKEVENLIK